MLVFTHPPVPVPVDPPLPVFPPVGVPPLPVAPPLPVDPPAAEPPLPPALLPPALLPPALLPPALLPPAPPLLLPPAPDPPAPDPPAPLPPLLLLLPPLPLEPPLAVLVPPEPLPPLLLLPPLPLEPPLLLLLPPLPLPPLPLPPVPPEVVAAGAQAISANARLAASRARGAKPWVVWLLADRPESSRAARELVESMDYLQGASEGRVLIPHVRAFLLFNLSTYRGVLLAISRTRSREGDASLGTTPEPPRMRKALFRAGANAAAPSFTTQPAITSPRLRAAFTKPLSKARKRSSPSNAPRNMRFASLADARWIAATTSSKPPLPRTLPRGLPVRHNCVGA